MKVKVIKPFRDKVTKMDYAVGLEIEFDEQIRIDDMVNRGLVKIIIEQTEQLKPRKIKG